MINTAQKWVSALVAAIAFSASSVLADSPIFGNSLGDGSGFSLVAYNGLSMSGGAVAFTPDQDFDLTSVTLWLSGYTGQNGQNIDVSIWGNNNNSPSVPMISFAPVEPNDGSLAPFTFSNPSVSPYNDPSGTTLTASEYWLVVTAGGQPGNYMEAANWAGGSTPTGPAAYDGASSYDVYFASFDPSSDLPAFTINGPTTDSVETTPEPSTLSLLSIPLLVGLAGLIHKRRKLRGEMLKPVPVKAIAASSRNRSRP